MNTTNTRSKKISLVVAALVIIFSASFFFKFLDTAVAQSQAASEETRTDVLPEIVNNSLEETRGIIPEKISISAIKLGAEVQKIGLTKNGKIANPTNFKDVGWFTGSVKPGENGTALIVGHVDNAFSLAGVFKHIHKLTPGTLILVRQGDETRIFEVTGTEEFPYDAKLPSRVLETGGEPRLNLITCTGTWLKKARVYDKRLVVYSRLVR